MRWVNMFKANMRKELLELQRYLPNTVAMIFTFYLIFLGLLAGIKVIAEPSTQDYSIQYMIVSYVFWFLATMVLQHIGSQITREAMRGTLEQLYMSPLGFLSIMTARLIASLLIYLIIITGLLFISMLTANQWLNIDIFTILPIVFFTFISMIGIGFVIAGLSVIWKQVGSFLEILQFLIAGLTIILLSEAPFLSFFPFVKGVNLIRDLMIENITLTQIGFNDYLSLILNAVVYLSIGILIFSVCERIALNRASLSHY